MTKATLTTYFLQLTRIAKLKKCIMLSDFYLFRHFLKLKGMCLFSNPFPDEQGLMQFPLLQDYKRFDVNPCFV